MVVCGAKTPSDSQAIQPQTTTPIIRLDFRGKVFFIIRSLTATMISYEPNVTRMPIPVDL